MKKLLTFVESVWRDASIVGLGPYLHYRYRSYRKNKEPMPVRVAGHEILVRPSTPDLRVAFNSLRHEFDVLSELLPQDYSGIIVDAGGYIGTAALKLSVMYPQASIVSIEASDSNYAMLLKNTSTQGNIHAIRAALYSESGCSMPLVDRGTGDWGFSIALHEKIDSERRIGTVNTITFADILREFPGKSIGLVKMDIEGGEYEIFKDPSTILHNIPAVFVELHDRIVPGCTEVFMHYCRGRWVLNAGGEKLLSLAGKPSISFT